VSNTTTEETVDTSTPDSEITSLYNSVRDSGQIRDMMSLSNFLNPIDETPGDIEQQDALDQVLARHIP